MPLKLSSASSAATPWEGRLSSRFDKGPEPAPGTLGTTGDPKGEAGAAKSGLSNISPAAQFYEGAVMERGAAKYGAYNWADHSLQASTYYNAILRHLNQWWLGEDIDPGSGYPHMAHLRASTGILIDQQAAGRLLDDRPKHLAPLAPVFQDIERVKASNTPLISRPRGSSKEMARAREIPGVKSVSGKGHD